MATPTKNLKPFKQTDFFTDDDNRVKEFMNKSGVRDKIYQMSQKYGVSPSEIVYTIYKETGGSFSPQQKGSDSSAIGLFQIMPEEEGATYRDINSYESWPQGLENTNQWRMKDGETWGEYNLTPGEQYSSKNQKGYQKGKQRFYMDDIAKMNELQQLELMDLYLGDKFRGSHYGEGTTSKGKAGDIYTAVAYPDAIGASEDDTVIEKGTDAYKHNASWRTNRFFGNITGGSIKDFGGREDDWNKFNNEVLGYTENYVPTEATSPYPQFKFDDKGKVTFDSTPETKPKPKPETKPEQNIPTESIVDYSQFELPSFESDNTRVAPFPPVPTTGGVGPWDMFMNSYKESGLPTEGFKEGGQVIKNNDMQYKKYKHGGMHYGVPHYEDGGLFKSVFGKKFKDSGFGKGVRDFGVATLNTAASPLESLMGTDFGIDEKFGYKTKFGDIYGGVGETVGSALGQLAPAALNLVAPGAGTGLSLAAQGIGSGLEGAGVTQDISTDPQSATGANIGSMLNMFAGMNPSGGAGQFTQGIADTGFMQNLAGIFTGGQTPVNKHGGMNYKYYQGGMAKPDIEVESGEVINSPGSMRSFTPGAPLKGIGNNAVEVGGNISHEQQGVKVGLDKNAQVFSATLKPQGSKETYAQIAKTLNQAISQATEQMKSSDPITSGTAKLNLDKYNKKLSDLFSSQQKQNKGNTNVMAKYGGSYMPKAKNGLWANIHAKRERGGRMRSPGDPGAPTDEAFKNSQARYGMQYMKAQNGLQYNPNFGGSTGGGFGGMYGTGTQGGSLQNPNMNNIFGSTNFQTSPELQAQMNSFNTLYGGGQNPGGFGNLQGSNPSQYEQVPFESQYSGLKGMLPYASSALNLGLGLHGLKNMDEMMLDPSKYMVNPKIPNTQINKSAAMAPTMDTLATLMNQTGDIKRKQAYASSFAPKIAERSGSIDFMQGKLDANAASEANKYAALNKSTLYGVDLKNRETQSLPYQFLGQAASDISSTAMQMGENKKMEQLLYNMYPEYRNVNS